MPRAAPVRPAVDRRRRGPGAGCLCPARAASFGADSSAPLVVPCRSQWVRSPPIAAPLEGVAERTARVFVRHGLTRPIASSTGRTRRGSWRICRWISAKSWWRDLWGGLTFEEVAAVGGVFAADSASQIPGSADGFTRKGPTTVDTHRPGDEDNLSDFERRLARWRPDSSGLDADAMMFAAGAASVERGGGQRFWLGVVWSSHCAGRGTWYLGAD